MKPPKIVIVGAGSLEFSARLTADCLSYPALSSAQFALVDIDPERLEFAGRIFDQICIRGGYDAKATLHQEVSEALPGADFVITSILVGGFEAIQAEIDIPHRYGVSQAIGDTLTPGGIMRCLRTLPVQASIAQSVMEHCPNALVLNYTNPMAMLCEGMMNAAPGINLVGLCHSVQNTTKEWAARLGLEYRSIEFACAGLNHQAWITRFTSKGRNLLPKIRALATREDIWRSDTSRMEYVKHFGFPVTEASGHNSEYSPWFRKTEAHIERYCPGGGWNGGHGFIKTLYNRPDWRDTMQRMANWETPIDLSRSQEYGSQIIHAVTTGESEIIYGNVRNKGLINNLPSSAIVEVRCKIGSDGLKPEPFGDLPEHLAAINRNQVNVQRLAVLAAESMDPEVVFQAMCLDPLTSAVLSLDDIRQLTQELLVAHAAFLPAAFAQQPLISKPRFDPGAAMPK
jgi:alpha-galactosidase